MNNELQMLINMLKKKPSKKRKSNDEEEEAMEQLKSLFKPPENTEKDKNHIYLYSDINQHTCLDLNRKLKEMEKDLLKHAIEYDIEPPSIYLHINSSGGCLFSAFGTVDTIINLKVPVVSIVEGNAASAATVISMVCNKRYATANSFMLIHQLSSGVYGNYQEIKDNFKNDTEIMNQLYNLYLNHTSMDIKTIKKVLKHDRYWNTDKCKKLGLIDDIWTGINININFNNVAKTRNVQQNVATVTNPATVKNVVNVTSDIVDSDDDVEIVTEKKKPTKKRRKN